jgi:peptidoglycan hydrolase-like protein with peptidoglycan-binding domain
LGQRLFNIEIAMRLKGSVGKGGRNIPGDAMYVQILLSDWLLVHGKPAIAIDGIVGSQTASAIREFQQENTAVVDGLVEPDRSTIKALEKRHLETIAQYTFIAPAIAEYSSRQGTKRETAPSISAAGLVDVYLNRLRGK